MGFRIFFYKYLFQIVFLIILKLTTTKIIINIPFNVLYIKFNKIEGD